MMGTNDKAKDTNKNINWYDNKEKEDTICFDDGDYKINSDLAWKSYSSLYFNLTLKIVLCIMIHVNNNDPKKVVINSELSWKSDRSLYYKITCNNT